MSQCLSLFLSISFSSQSDNIYVYATYCRGSLIGHPVENIRIVLTDGASHQVDSSELAFKLAAIYAFRQVSHILDMDNTVSSELLGHECQVFYNICFSFSVLHCCQTCNIRTCDEGRTEISDRVPGNSNWRHEQVSCLFPQAMHLW